MVRMHRPDVAVLWNDTRVEHPETYKLAKLVTEKWGLNLITTKPETTFWQIKGQYGWPMKGRGVGDVASEVCCRELKKKPTKKAIKEHRWDLSFVGLNAAESRHRRLSANKYGDYFYSKTWGMQRCYPILWWSLEEIWNYIVFNNVPISEVYRPLPNIPGKTAEEVEWEFRAYPGEEQLSWQDLDVVQAFVKGYIPRTGCWCCPIGLKFGKLAYMRRFYPRLYNTLVVKQGLGLELLNQSDNGYPSLFPPTQAEVEETLAMRPCAFDYA